MARNCTSTATVLALFRSSTVTRGGLKKHFERADAVRYKECTVAQRSNARLKEFSRSNIRVRGAGKMMSHLMLGLLVLTAD